MHLEKHFKNTLGNIRIVKKYNAKQSRDSILRYVESSNIFFYIFLDYNIFIREKITCYYSYLQEEERQKISHFRNYKLNYFDYSSGKGPFSKTKPVTFMEDNMEM